ncbi:MAG: cupin domain-containing protein [Pseudomonadota bacterium]
MLPPVNWPRGLDAQRFIREYWQRRPLLLRNAFPALENPLPADELAGLACEPEVPSRLVIESRGERPWELRSGPFDSETFDWLGTAGWSLMVTDLDKVLPDFRDALAPFRFIPDWRIDDLMASFAPPGGSVGPHFDAYDVFLIQLEGRRRWDIGPEPEAGYTLRGDTDLKIIEQPQFDDSHVLEPGDMLYLPPRYAHHGVALDPCITWSIGFRAPAVGELAAAWGDSVASDLPGDTLYADAGFAPQANPGELTRAAADALRARVREALDGDGAAFDLFLGQHLTDRAADTVLRGVELDPPTLRALAADEDRRLERHAAIRFAFVEYANHATLFAGGVPLTTHAEAARAVCEHTRWQGDALAALLDVDGATELLIALGALGFVVIDDDND